MNDTQKYKVMSLLQQHTPPKDIAEDMDVSYGAVLKLRRQFDEAKTNGTIDKLLSAKDLVLDIAEEVLSVIPVEEAAADLTKGLNGIEHLSEQFQKTAIILDTQIRNMLISVTDLSELEIATDILCKLQTAFVNKQMTQVNVQNNYGDSTPKYNQFLGDKPSD